MNIKNTALIIVPHQDDETNLVGNIMDVLTQYEVYVLYSSIDTNPRHAIVRKQEATAACAVWGINREHIIFLGKPGDYEEKFERLKIFYKKGLNQVGWNKYSRISLEFSNQIICTKKEK